METSTRQSATVWLVIASVLVASIGAVGAVSARDGGEIALVVSRQWSGAEGISLAELRQIYLGKREQLAGARVEPWQQRGGDPIRLAFDEVVLEKAGGQLEGYWIQQALLGGAKPPKTARSFEAMLDRVRGHVGALGYVDAKLLHAQPQSDIKVLAVVVAGRPLRPGEGGYPLRY